MASTTTDTPEARQLPRQLPTRVSNACERCRRNKSRCDPFRPCSLCVKANVECSFTSVEVPSRAPKRRRTRGPSYDNTQLSDQRVAVDIMSGLQFHPEEQPAIQTHGSSPREIETNVTIDVESRRPSVANGEADSAVGIAQKICQLSNQDILKRTTSAIPGGDLYGKRPPTRLDRTQRRPISSILSYALPPADIMRTLLEEYFDTVHWFSLVIYEPRFRVRFESIKDGLAYPSQKPFLILLSTVLGMGAWYRSHKSRTDLNHLDQDWQEWALSLLQGAGSKLTDLMDQTSIAAVQTCILLGSYYVYHGRPNLSFALLGATIKTAQAIGLHRQPLQGDPESIEERKRVWWTIYTWDRFASVTYGRPLGIDDQDCNVAHPVDVYESPYFGVNNPKESDDSICYSFYQRELNKLYLIASPIIKTIYGIRTVGPDKRLAEHQYTTQIMEVSEGMWAWRRRLSPHLLLDLSSDCDPNRSRSSRVHQLQALSLQLTFDNLLIIIHRPLLAQQVDHLIRNQPENVLSSTYSPSAHSHVATSSAYAGSADSPLSRPQVSSTELWWNAALRTSKVTEMPQLAQMATDSHLVAFLAVNLFNSAVVMVVLALSDPLSDRAQEVKRTITRIFRLQELLGKKTKLSMQSNVVLKDVIHMLLHREAEAMLAPVDALKTLISENGDKTPTSSEVPLMSVEDTLRLPIQLSLDSVNWHSRSQQHSTTNKVLRLNESLASVQRVLPAGFDGVHGDDSANTEGWDYDQDVSNDLCEGSNDAWFHTNFQSFDAEGEPGWTNEPSNFDATGNGLYWFWDSAWSDAQL